MARLAMFSAFANKTTSVILISCALHLIAACQNSNFSGNTAQRPVEKPAPSTKPKPPMNSDDATPDSPDDATIKEDFMLDKTAGGIDMVWLIDTSGSMREETAQVQRNFANFAATLSSRAGIKFALVANKGGMSGSSIGIDIGSSSNRQQIDYSVGSTNALAIAAAAVCPAGTSTSSGSSGFFDPLGGSTTICSQSVSRVEGSSRFSAVAGQLAGFFRPEAKPVFVVVTDDNALGVTDQNFISLVQPHLNGKTPTMYAFRGMTSRAGCNVASPGTAYDNLANVTGGKVFDICEADWSPNFDSLGKAVVELVKYSFDLRESVSKIISVNIDGRPLGAGDYTVNGRTLTLSKSAASADAVRLDVVYETTK